MDKYELLSCPTMVANRDAMRIKANELGLSVDFARNFYKSGLVWWRIDNELSMTSIRRRLEEFSAFMEECGYRLGEISESQLTEFGRFYVDFSLIDDFSVE